MAFKIRPPVVLPLNENINFIFANIILRIERVKYVKYVPLKELSGFIFCLTFVKDALCFILSATGTRKEFEFFCSLSSFSELLALL